MTTLEKCIRHGPPFPAAFFVTARIRSRTHCLPLIRAFAFGEQTNEKEIVRSMKSKIKALCRRITARAKNRDKGRMLYTAFIVPTLISAVPANAFAADTIWSKASEIMKDVYTQVLAISTIAAVVTASIALLLMNFSKSGRTVDESRAWLKRIIITWAILNSLGFIMAYITPFFSGGAWTA